MNPKKIIIGTELLSGSRGRIYSPSKVKSFFDNALLIGINQIDTAPSYGKNFKVEKIIGKTLLDKRKKFEITTKFNNLKYKFNSKKKLQSIKDMLSQSLENLKTNYIDNYFFHSGDDKEFFDDGIWHYLNDQKSKKIINNLGLAIKHDLVKKGNLLQIEMAKEYGINKISTTLNMYSRESMEKVIPFCRENKIAVWSRMPLAKGLLSGNYKSVNQLKKNDTRFKYEKDISNLIINYTIRNKININKALKWVSRNSDRIVIGFKDINQLKKVKNEC